MTELNVDDELLRPGDVAKRLGITTKTLKNILKREGVKVILLQGGNYRVRSSDIDRIFPYQELD